MDPLLFLCHRIPYPPNKGDKIHTYHTLRHLAQRYRIYLGTFVDDPADWQYVDAVRAWCADAWFGRISPWPRKLWSARGLLGGEALSVAYYHDAGLRRWVDSAIERHGIRKALAYSSAMAQYVVDRAGLRTVLDVGDVDSAKWAQYGSEHRWPLSAIYRREGRALLAYEVRVVRAATAGLFHTVGEAELLLAHAPDLAGKVFGIPNGVDAAFFSPSRERPNPYGAREEPIVFTGAMDYWPNVDAVRWFARELMPRIRDARPNATFWIVGLNPAPAVQALARDPFVTVTGRVDDVRPYLQHSALFVAPLRLARGIQNKVLEAMAMGCPVIASTATLNGVRADVGTDLEIATTGDEFVAKALELLGSPRAAAIGRAARARVVADYDWERLLAGYDRILDAESVARLDLPGCRPSPGSSASRGAGRDCAEPTTEAA